MYCQPHSGILIGTLSQATLLPPPMSPHVENPHSMSWRNRECQVTIFFLLFYPCCEDWLGARAFFSCVPPSLSPPLFFFSLLFFFFFSFFGFPRSPFLQSMTSWGRSWTTASWFRVQSGAGGRPPLRWPPCRSWGPSFTNTSTCTSTNTPTSTPSRPSPPVCPRPPSSPRPPHPPWCVPKPEMWG